MNRTKLSYIAHFVDLAEIWARLKSWDEVIGRPIVIHQEFPSKVIIMCCVNVPQSGHVLKKGTQANHFWLKTQRRDLIQG